MKPFEQAAISEEEIMKTFEALAEAWSSNHPHVRQQFPGANLEEVKAGILAFVRGLSDNPVFKNDVYQVQVRRFGDWLSLSIKRIDRQPIHDWRDMQKIKTEILGPDVEAVELYPKESRVVDTANQYFLWASVEPGFQFPFGWDSGRTVSDMPLYKSKQRPLNET